MYLSHQGLVIFKWFFRSYTIFLCLFLLQTLVILLWLRYLIQTYTCFRYFSSWIETNIIFFCYRWRSRRRITRRRRRRGRVIPLSASLWTMSQWCVSVTPGLARPRLASTETNSDSPKHKHWHKPTVENTRGRHSSHQKRVQFYLNDKFNNKSIQCRFSIFYSNFKLGTEAVSYFDLVPHPWACN